MKEQHFFYVPHAGKAEELPQEEAAHALRVLRLKTGDPIRLFDGTGGVYEAVITAATGKHCFFRIEDSKQHPRLRQGKVCLAVAPTKNLDRMEWLAEKATEIGIDALTFLRCDHSERKAIKTERIDKIFISAMKQSRQTWKPALSGLTPFAGFVRQRFDGQKFIAHCYDEADLCGGAAKPFLLNSLTTGNALVLTGPEGDFSPAEVREALRCGFLPVSLGNSRLRTETAALVAVHLMNLKNQNV